MKKFISIFLSAIVFLSLTGCGKSESSASASEGPPEYVEEGELSALYTSPDKYKGKYVKLTGQVFLDPEKDEDGICFQMFADPENGERNTVVVCRDLSLKLKEDDYVSLDGKILGAYKGSNALGGTVTALQIEAASLEVIGYKDAMRPTLKDTAPALTQEQHGCSVTVDKIEFAQQETRVYLTVKNGSEDKFHFYSFDCKIVQEGKQFEEENNYYADYEEIPSELLPGVTATGVIAFPAVDSAKEFQFLTEGRSDNYRLDFEPYTFAIAAS